MNLAHEVKSLALTLETDGHEKSASMLRKAASQIEELDEVRRLLGIDGTENTVLDVLRSHPDWHQALGFQVRRPLRDGAAINPSWPPKDIGTGAQS